MCPHENDPGLRPNNNEPVAGPPDFRLLAFIFGTVFALYYLAILFSIVANSSSIQKFAASLLNTPSLVLGPCGAIGAAITQTTQKQNNVARGAQLLCLLFIGAVAGLCVPALIQSGIFKMSGSGNNTAADGSQAIYMVIAVVCGGAGERFFTAIGKRIFGN